MNAKTFATLVDAYGVLADVHHNWPGRDSKDGQRLLCDLRNAISAESGLSDEFVQINARSLIVRAALAKAGAA